MTYFEYRKYVKFIKSYISLEGYKTKFISNSSDKYLCSCGRQIYLVKHVVPFLIQEGYYLVFYIAYCETCRLAYIHKYMEVKTYEDILSSR